MSRRRIQYPAGRCAHCRIAFSSARKWSAVSFSGDTRGSWVLGGPEMVFPAGTDTGAHLAEDSAHSQARDFALSSSPTAPTRWTPGPKRCQYFSPVILLTFREKFARCGRDTQLFCGAGRRVRIISGDNPQTVAAIARNVGLDAAEGFDAPTFLQTMPNSLVSRRDRGLWQGDS